MMNLQFTQELKDTAKALVTPGKGILAADESTPTIKKRLDSISVESTEETRRTYRDILFTTEGIEEFISGIILFDETIRQKSENGISFPQLLLDKGILPGIKVDGGAKQLALAEKGEMVAEGLDGLRERLQEYYKLGARFAKWRAVITIADELPSDYCIYVNAHALARYAALCQENGLVPIVEPEVLMDGGNMDHDIKRAEEVTTRAHKAVFKELHMQHVMLEGIILKPSMVLPGKSATKANSKEIAEATIRCFKASVPESVPGCVFLSGGQSDIEATENMNEINRMGPHPWELSFSFGRALQAPVLKAWQGKEENIKMAQKAFYHRAKMNGLARRGEYTKEMEKET